MASLKYAAMLGMRLKLRQCKCAYAEAAMTARGFQCLCVSFQMDAQSFILFDYNKIVLKSIESRCHRYWCLPGQLH
jgi:hypothetical protein